MTGPPAGAGAPLPPDRTARVLWVLCLAACVVAAASGILYRWAALHGMPWGLEFGHVRHAHSHLMYLGWLVPAVFLGMTAGVRRMGARTGALHTWTALSWLTGLVTFPAFLAWGYGPVAVGGRVLPMAAILSGLCVFAWYGFVGAWWRVQRGRARTVPLRLWNLSLWMLAVSSTGGWAQMWMNLRGVTHPFWSRATIHIFLDILALGFVIPAVLGLLLAIHGRRHERPAGSADPLHRQGAAVVSRALTVLAIAVPFTFLLGMRPDQLTGAGRVLGGLAGPATALALVLLAAPLWKGWRRPHVPASLPALLWLPAAALAAGLALAGLPGVLELVHAWDLRLLWLHLVFLATLTPALVHVAVAEGWQPWHHAPVAMTATALVLLVSLVPLTAAWPEAWQGRWVMSSALVAACVPSAVLLVLLLDSVRARREPA